MDIMNNINLQDISFATLFVFLLIYVIKENKNREEKYLKTIEINNKIILEQTKNNEILEEILNKLGE